LHYRRSEHRRGNSRVRRLRSVARGLHTDRRKKRPSRLESWLGRLGVGIRVSAGAAFRSLRLPHLPLTAEARLNRRVVVGAAARLHPAHAVVGAAVRLQLVAAAARGEVAAARRLHPRPDREAAAVVAEPDGPRRPAAAVAAVEPGGQPSAAEVEEPAGKHAAEAEAQPRRCLRRR